MEWTQFVIFCVGVFGLFVWNRTESRQDARHMDAKLESNRNLSLQIHNENREKFAQYHKENQDIINAIRQDIKEFHGRLCTIEERNKEKK